MTFNGGERAKEITFIATQDTDDDDGESVELQFAYTVEGVSAGATSTATVSILDDDDPTVSVSFGANSYIVTEGSTTTVNVYLSKDPRAHGRHPDHPAPT